MEEKSETQKLPKALKVELRKTEQRPSWESSNEGVHERVSFNDTLWGFDLAGGAYYSAPLRVTQVKEGSRAELAGIKNGDVLKSINGIPSYTMTIQEAHDAILESGLEIKLAFSAPDVEGTMYSVYQDEIVDDETESNSHGQVPDAKKRKFNGAKINNAWSEAWPCNKKRNIMYRESNCFMVPSKYEKTHPENYYENQSSD